jgi:predicted NAD/FAD-dependent oxidoreductase
VLLVLMRRHDGANVWQAWSEGRELRQPNYAERIQHAAFFRTRANTWSNLAYVVVGLYACAVAAGDWGLGSSVAGAWASGDAAAAALAGLLLPAGEL